MNNNYAYTFVMALKNRRKRAINSIKSIITQSNSDMVKFVIIEDISDDILNLKSDVNLEYMLVDSGYKWNKSILLNQVIPILDTKYISFWDSDFIFSDKFIFKYSQLVSNTNFNTN